MRSEEEVKEALDYFTKAIQKKGLTPSQHLAFSGLITAFEWVIGVDNTVGKILTGEIQIKYGKEKKEKNVLVEEVRLVDALNKLVDAKFDLHNAEKHEDPEGLRRKVARESVVLAYDSLSDEVAKLMSLGMTK